MIENLEELGKKKTEAIQRRHNKLDPQLVRKCNPIVTVINSVLIATQPMLCLNLSLKTCINSLLRSHKTHWTATTESLTDVKPIVKFQEQAAFELNQQSQ